MAFLGRNVYDQLVPVGRLGNEYVTIKAEPENTLFILATEGNTNVSPNGAGIPLFTLKRGKQGSIDISNTCVCLESTASISIFKVY